MAHYYFNVFKVINTVVCRIIKLLFLSVVSFGASFVPGPKAVMNSALHKKIRFSLMQKPYRPKCL